MRVVTAGEMRELDQRTIAACGVSGIELMDRAGRGFAREICRLCQVRGLAHPVIRMIAGKGNNGGDVFAAAYHLCRHFLDLEIALVGACGQLVGETRWHYERVIDLVKITCLPAESDWDDLVWYGGVDIVVDGLLGTGARGAPREPVASAIRCMNRMRQNGALVVAIDMPSGVCADTGHVSSDAVCADFTFTMGLPKVGMLLAGANAYTGTVDVLDIGIPDSFVPPEDAVGLRMIAGDDVRGWLPPRPRESHKGIYGRVLVIGGSPGMSGAVSMAAQAACRSGAGLVHVLVPVSLADRVAQFVPEAMVYGGLQRDDGGLAASAHAALGDLSRFDAIVVGPGLGCHADGVGLLQAVLRASVGVVVMDADALTLLSENKACLGSRCCGSLILTPHPGEAARLLGMETATVQSDRVDAVKSLALQYDAVAVLKGARTLVSCGGDCWVNMTGNPGMASGGSGDVLAGMIAALAAQGEDALLAACSAVHIHGVAGDLGALAGSQNGLTATQISDWLPQAFGWVLGR